MDWRVRNPSVKASARELIAAATAQFEQDGHTIQELDIVSGREDKLRFDPIRFDPARVAAEREERAAKPGYLPQINAMYRRRNK